MSIRRALAPTTPLALLCGALTALLLALVLGARSLGPLDDHQMVITLFQGRSFGAYVMPELGRFFPLTAQEYAALTWTFGASAPLFYAFNALKLIPCAVLLYVLLRETRLAPAGVLALWATGLLSTGVANTLYRLSASELNSFALMLFAIWCYLKSDSGAICDRHRRMAARACGVAFFLSLFYKELAFIFPAVFGAAEVWRCMRTRNTRPNRLLLALVAMGVLYIGGYAWWNAANVTHSYAAQHASSFEATWLQFQVSDPFLLLVVLPLTALRAVFVLARPASHTAYDSMLLAASAFVAAYLKLEIFAWYYLLPAYAFGLVGVAGVTARLFAPFRWLVILASSLGVAYTAPMSLREIYVQKTITNNHGDFVRFMADWLNRQPAPTPTPPRELLMMGVSPGDGVEILVSLKAFLTSLNVAPQAISIRGDLPNNNAAVAAAKLTEAQAAKPLARGDVKVYNPFQHVQTPPPDSIPSGDNIFRSKKEFYGPRWSGLQWVNDCLLDLHACRANRRADLRYIGYAAFAIKRPSVDVPPVPLKSMAYSIEPVGLPAKIGHDAFFERKVTIRNTGTQGWPANGGIHEGNWVNLAYRWLDAEQKVVMEGNRFPFAEPILPQDSITLSLHVQAPEIPGRYRLVISPVQEGVAWFPAAMDHWVVVE